MADCIFCKIVAGQIPAQRIVEDEHALAFPDINPTAPVHVLVIPKKHVPSLSDTDDVELIGRVMNLAAAVAKQEGIDETGYRTVVNTREAAGQTVHHLHAHVLGGRAMAWPPG